MTLARLEVPKLTVVRCNKVCRTCGTQWKGYFFHEWVANAPKEWHAEIPRPAKAYVRSECDDCIDRWENVLRRRDLEADLRVVDDLLRTGPPKGQKMRYMRYKLNVLKRLRDTYDDMSAGFCHVTGRMNQLTDAMKF